jgi:hypothetical protein
MSWVGLDLKIEWGAPRASCAAWRRIVGRFQLHRHQGATEQDVAFFTCIGDVAFLTCESREREIEEEKIYTGDDSNLFLPLPSPLSEARRGRTIPCCMTFFM